LLPEKVYPELLMLRFVRAIWTASFVTDQVPSSPPKMAPMVPEVVLA
jgi:hypothetical protein